MIKMESATLVLLLLFNSCTYNKQPYGIKVANKLFNHYTKREKTCLLIESTSQGRNRFKESVVIFSDDDNTFYYVTHSGQTERIKCHNSLLISYAKRIRWQDTSEINYMNGRILFADYSSFEIKLHNKQSYNYYYDKLRCDIILNNSIVDFIDSVDAVHRELIKKLDNKHN